MVTADGKVYTAGDVKTEVSIQSISKVFTMAQVIQEQGLESVEKQIGVDATGARFNSIIAVEGVRTVVGTGAPEMNPLVNPGAISATSMVTGATADAVWKKIIGFHNDAAGRQLTVLQDVYKSESDTNQRNQAIGALMLAYGYIKSNWQQAVDLYTRQCSIGVNAQGPRDDGGDARRRRQEPGHRQAGDGRREGAGRARGDGDGRPLRRLRASGSITPACRPRAASAAASSPSRRASSASRSCRRRSTMPATASARSGRSPTSRTRSAAIRTRRDRSN